MEVQAHTSPTPERQSVEPEPLDYETLEDDCPPQAGPGNGSINISSGQSRFHEPRLENHIQHAEKGSHAAIQHGK